MLFILRNVMFVSMSVGVIYSASCWCPSEKMKMIFSVPKRFFRAETSCECDLQSSFGKDGSIFSSRTLVDLREEIRFQSVFIAEWTEREKCCSSLIEFFHQRDLIFIFHRGCGESFSSADVSIERRIDRKEFISSTDRMRSGKGEKSSWSSGSFVDVSLNESMYERICQLICLVLRDRWMLLICDICLNNRFDRNIIPCVRRRSNCVGLDRWNCPMRDQSIGLRDCTNEFDIDLHYWFDTLTRLMDEVRRWLERCELEEKEHLSLSLPCWSLTCDWMMVGWNLFQRFVF